MCETESSGNFLDLLLQNAIKPAGSTLYVWGGGWNETDDGSGETALHMGVWPEWKSWFHSHRKGYSYEPGRIAWEKGKREQRFFGLDCSGYVGWCVYQMKDHFPLLRVAGSRQTSPGNSAEKNRSPSGYVVPAEEMAGSLAECGYGSVRKCTPEDVFGYEDDINLRSDIRSRDDIGLRVDNRRSGDNKPNDNIRRGNTFRPGDIVSLKGHCFICLGQCEDGSVLVLHSTPNGGVQVSGTVSDSSARGGGTVSAGRISQASKLAADFMQRHYPEWWESFGCEGRQAVDASVYLNGTKFSLNMESGVMDGQNLGSRSAQEVLHYLDNYV